MGLSSHIWTQSHITELLSSGEKICFGSLWVHVETEGEKWMIVSVQQMKTAVKIPSSTNMLAMKDVIM